MTDPLVPYSFTRLHVDEMHRDAAIFFQQMNRRRSIREFAPDAVPRELIEYAIRTAATAPSGAHQQPWKFVAISDPIIKQQIRSAAEKEEYESYEGGRMSAEWLAALRRLGTTWEKPFLEVAPWIVVVFEETYGELTDGTTRKHYYVKESVGIACGIFIAAIHQMGLATLTHTPSPMAFLADILERPKNERPFMLFPIGYPAEGTKVPNIQRKPLDDVAVWLSADE